MLHWTARPAGALHRAINVASTDFRMCDDDGTILGLLVGEGGQVVGIRLRPDVANEMTRNMLRTARAASTCRDADGHEKGGRNGRLFTLSGSSLTG